jgi:hypothetical protein
MDEGETPDLMNKEKYSMKGQPLLIHASTTKNVEDDIALDVLGGLTIVLWCGDIGVFDRWQVVVL